MEYLKDKEKTTKITNSMYWWLNKKRPFVINDEYLIELLDIDKKRSTVRILITNLKDNSQTVIEESPKDGTEQTI